MTAAEWRRFAEVGGLDQFQRPPFRQNTPAAAPEIRAKDVQVEKIFRACCLLPDCGWKGEEHATFAKAGDERTAHITGHRLAAEHHEEDSDG